MKHQGKSLHVGVINRHSVTTDYIIVSAGDFMECSVVKHCMVTVIRAVYRMELFILHR